jgi:hypothetical protein
VKVPQEGQKPQDTWKGVQTTCRAVKDRSGIRVSSGVLVDDGRKAEVRSLLLSGLDINLALVLCNLR